MKTFVLDTNVYVFAFRSPAGARALIRFHEASGPSTLLSSIVLHELLVGANTAAKAREIRRRIARPLERAGRVLTPSHSAWKAAGDAIARMARVEGRELRSVPKSLVHDFLLAASCGDAGATLVTDNVTDFEGIRRFLTFRFTGAWPDRIPPGEP